MKRFAIAIVLVAACSGQEQEGRRRLAVAAARSDLAKKIRRHWGIDRRERSAEIFLQTTDETGKQVSHPVGTYKGQCQAITPAAEMKAVIGVRCAAGAHRGRAPRGDDA